MKKVLMTTALIAALGTSSAMAQSIQPVTTAPATDVTNSSGGLFALGGGLSAAAIAGIVAATIVIVGITSDDDDPTGPVTTGS